MNEASGRRPGPCSEAGFTLTELIIASGAFVVILTAAMSMLVQWQRITGSSESDINAVNQATMAVSQIAGDIRGSTYLYQYATISLVVPAAVIKPAGEATSAVIPLVTQDATCDNAAFDAAVTDRSLMGPVSTGTCLALGMISDQPYGLTLPRYIVYWVGPRTATLKSKISASQDLGLYPLYRLEASPSANNVDHSPHSMYTFTDSMVSAKATSTLNFTLTDANNGTLIENKDSMPITTTVKCRLTKVADIVLGGGLPGPFTLRNPHPYSNGTLFSPYYAVVSIRVSRVGRGALRGGNLDLMQLTTSAFARNVPLPQLKGS